MTRGGIIVLQKVRRFGVKSETVFDRVVCSAWFARVLVGFLILAAGWMLGYFQVRGQMGF